MIYVIIWSPRSFLTISLKKNVRLGRERNRQRELMLIIDSSQNFPPLPFHFTTLSYLCFVYIHTFIYIYTIRIYILCEISHSTSFLSSGHLVQYMFFISSIVVGLFNLLFKKSINKIYLNVWARNVFLVLKRYVLKAYTQSSVYMSKLCKKQKKPKLMGKKSVDTNR